MGRPLPDRRFRRGVAAAMVLLAMGVSVGGAAEEAAPSAAAFERAEADAIRAAARDILSQPRFVRSPSFLEWLLWQLSSWDLPAPELGPGWGEFVLWTLLVVCAATLAVILGHLAWTIGAALRARRRSAAPASPLPYFGLAPPDATYDDLDVLRQRLAGEGRFREAVAVLMAALLRWLDGRRVLVWHPSKTNGDYVREFSASATGRDAFRRFVWEFDGTVYGGAACGGETYRHLDTLFERVRGHVHQGP